MSIYIDSNVVISVLSGDSKSGKAMMLLEGSESNKVDLVCSVIMFGEVLYGGQAMEAKEFLLRAPIDYVDVNKNIMLRVAEMRLGHKKLKVPDAIHLATALFMGCSELISDDAVLRKIASKYINCREL